MEVTPMKCLSNARTGSIVRISDSEAEKLVGSQWQFIPKSKWKEATRKVDEKQTEEVAKKEKTVSQKVERHKQIKAKQRPMEGTDKLMI